MLQVHLCFVKKEGNMTAYEKAEIQYFHILIYTSMNGCGERDNALIQHVRYVKLDI